MLLELPVKPGVRARASNYWLNYLETTYLINIQNLMNILNRELNPIISKNHDQNMHIKAILIICEIEVNSINQMRVV